MLKVHVLYEHGPDLRPHGCSYIRLLQPLRYLAEAGQLRVTAGPEYDQAADVVVVERMWRPHGLTMDAAERLVRLIRRTSARLIYTLDDNLLDLEVDCLAQTGVTEAQRQFIRYLAREADGVIVSTTRLSERMQSLNPNTVVVPNAIDERLFAPARSLAAPSRRPGRVVIGFMGTYSHDTDLAMIVQPLRAVLRRHRETVELQFVGGVADAKLWQAFDGLPIRLLSTTGHEEYPIFVGWLAQTARWDLGLAPLVDTPFTRCKSDLKFLDYGALGIPGLYSDVPVYSETISHLTTGFLVQNTMRDWAEALEALVTDVLLRRRLAQDAHDYVWSHRMLKQYAHRWPRIIEQLVG
ncbi:MAG: glycosyltransferase family 4 protein [Anaerolineales bacterium]